MTQWAWLAETELTTVVSDERDQFAFLTRRHDNKINTIDSNTANEQVDSEASPTRTVFPLPPAGPRGPCG